MNHYLLNFENEKVDYTYRVTFLKIIRNLTSPSSNYFKIYLSIIRL